jgi:hypothetical protein
MISLRRALPVIALLCVAALPAAPALAAKKSRARPTISSIGPLQVSVGDTITIRGHNFLAGSKRNKVTFQRAGSPAISARSSASTRTRMQIAVPASLAKYLTVSAGVAQPTVFQILLRGKRLGKGVSALKRSVLIGPRDVLGQAPGDCAAPDAIGGVTDSLDSAPVDDLTGDSLDTPLAQDPCAAGDSTDPGADPADGAPADDSAGGPGDPWDLLDAGAAGDTSTG